MKLVSVERSVCLYDNISHDITREFLLTISSDHNISVARLREIVVPQEEDPLLFEPYVLNLSQVLQLNEYLENDIDPDFKTHYYVLECTGIYD